MPKPNYLEETWSGMSWAERQVFNAAAVTLGHTKETLAKDDDAVVMLRKIAAEAGKTLNADAADQVGEALFDAAHEHCGDDGCTGGGAPWYGKVAARLVDPFGPLASIAVEQQITRDDTDNSEGRESLENPGWFALFRQQYRSVGQAVNTDNERLRRWLVAAGALVVEWLTDLDKREDAERESRVTRPYPTGGIAATTDLVHSVNPLGVRTLCCNQPVIDLPSGERWTEQQDLVNCTSTPTGGDTR